VRLWQADSSNVARVTGHLRLNGAPVAGARVSLDRYLVPRATARDGTFQTDVDITIPSRRVVHAVDLTHATVRGRALTAGQRSALLATSGAFNVGYRLQGLKAHLQSNHNVVVTGRLVGADGQAPPLVRLQTYQLRGTITDAAGKPVRGAVVITRTQDRDFWTHSSGSDQNGHYTSFFSASDETNSDPVPLSVGVALGGVSYGGVLGTNASFKRLRSAVMNIQLGAGVNYTLQTPSSYAGAVYSGLVVGVTVGGKVVKPLAARWPDATGTFSMTLPASVRGTTLHFWENARQFFSRFTARPGGAIDLTSWPTALGDGVSVGLATLNVP
jgi:hypothetical protein